MGNLFKTVITWLLSGLRATAQQLIDWLAPLWHWAQGIFHEAVVALWHGLRDVLPPDVVTFIDSINLGQWTGALEGVSWMLPVIPCLAIVSTGYGLCAVIRTLRWIKSCFPTVSGA